MDRRVTEALALRRKLLVLELARVTGNVVNTRREFGVPRSTVHNWKNAYDRKGKAGLVNYRRNPWRRGRTVSRRVLFNRKNLLKNARKS